MSNRWIQQEKFWVVALIAISLLPLLSLFTPGLPVTHDGQDHVARIANFYQSLREGNIVPRWGANLNWGYGHPILMFLYPLPSYIASVFRFMGFGLVDSVKLVFGISFVVSVCSMYVWIRSSWGRIEGLIAAFLYGFAPYRFVDLYVRGAIGEHVAFVSPPIIGYGLWRSLRKSEGLGSIGFGLVSLGTAGLILSHNALSMMFLAVLAVYTAYLLYFNPSRNKKRLLYRTILAVGIGFALSAFFWVPAYFEGKYTLRDVVTSDSLTGRFVPFLDFLYSPWSYNGSQLLSKWLGAGQILGLLLGMFMLFQRSVKRRLRLYLLGGVIITFVSIFLMTSISEFIWKAVTLMQKFQFPWRLLSVTTLVLPLIAAAAVRSMPQKHRVKAGIILVVLSVFSTVYMWRAKEYKQYDESFFTNVYDSTTDTGESSPVWSVRFMEKRAKAPLEIIEGKAHIVPSDRRVRSHVYTLDALTPSKLVENTLYFPGWNVIVDGVVVPVEFQNPDYRGLMTFDVSKGVHDVRVEFNDTKLRSAASLFSIMALVGYIVVAGSIHIWPVKKKS